MTDFTPSDPDDIDSGTFELQERQALRRVAGLSTELSDITEVEYRQLRLERVVLVGVWTEGSAADADNSLTELAALAETAGSQVLETKIETDRRRIRTRISKLKREIAGMRIVRQTKRAGRRRNAVPAVAIAGYTNAGKSSLLNRLTGAGVLVEDALFATLDPTTRRARTADGRVYTLSDTVGFVRHLPHQLVEAFRSTLEEVAEADLVVHVADGAHPDPEE